MSDKTNIFAMSDGAIMKFLGEFVRHHRLEQNKTQAQLANEAGINRATLSLIENGESSNLLTFIQLLRALKLLDVLNIFEVQEQISPIQLAKLQQAKRKRAGRLIGTNPSKQSDW